MSASSPKLRRVLRVRDGLAVTIGIIIGAGILRAPGDIAGYLQNTWLLLGVWVLGGVVAGLSTVVIAEMAAALPKAGGKYVYAREAYGPVAGFVAGWSELFVTRGFSGAAKAIVIAEYLVRLTSQAAGGENVEGPVRAIAGTVVLAYALLHLGGIKIGTVFQNITTVVKVVILFGIAAAGIWAGNAAGFLDTGPGLSASSVADSGGALLAFALSYQAVAFAYYGWEDAAKLSEETQDAGRALPRILLGGAVAVAVLYLLMNVAFLSALSPSEMAGSELVAQDAIAAVFGSAAGTVILVASLLILISSLNVNFLGLPRVAYGLARDGLAPKAFMEVSERGTPTKALFFISAVILFLVLSPTGAFDFLIQFMMLVAITVDTVVLSGVLRLRKTRPDLERPFKVPGYPVVPIVTLGLYVILFGIIVYTQPRLALGAGTMLGVLLIAGIRTASQRSASGTGNG